MLSVNATLRWLPARHARNGFTLIELLVTLTLFGLLTALSLPSFTGWIHNTQIRTVAEALQNGLRVAQTEALRRSMQVVFYRTNSPMTTANIGTPGTQAPSFAFAAGGVNWVVVTTPSFGSGTSEFVQGGALGSAASATTLTGPDAICFDANGRIATNAPSTLPTGVGCALPTKPFVASQTSADRELWVQVTTGGKVRMCDPKRTLSATVPDGC